MHHGSSIPDGCWKIEEFLTRSPLLAATGLVHGFTLRSAGDFKADPEAGRRLCTQVNSDRLRLLEQVHATRIVSPEDPAPRPQADGWAGRLANHDLLGVLTADCLPLLLYHEPTARVALLHAGWRGAVAGIIPRGIAALGVAAEELVAALGPAIGPCCYKVGEELARAAHRHRSCVEARGGGKYQFDLPDFARLELEAAGVSPTRIDMSGWCSCCHADLFFSHRRCGESERMCAFVASAPPTQEQG